MKNLSLIFLLLLSVASHANIGESSSQLEGHFISLLKTEISKNFNGAEVEFISPVRWIRSEGILGSDLSVSFLGTDGRGNAHFNVSDPAAGTNAEGWVGFSAWAMARIAIHRIKPGEPLNNEMFSLQRVNVATGLAYDYRGVLFPAVQQLSQIESIQTILEGQFLTSSAIQKIPDIRRGEGVRVHIVSGDLTLTTLGTAEEPSYVNKQLRVMAGKNKKELLGTLLPDRIVEVKL